MSLIAIRVFWCQALVAVHGWSWALVIVFVCVVVALLHVLVMSLFYTGVVLSFPHRCHHMSWLHVLVVLLLCRGILVVMLCHVVISCIVVVVVPHRWSIVILCLSRMGWEERGTGGTHRGVLTMMMNDKCFSSFIVWLPHCLDLLLET